METKRIFFFVAALLIIPLLLWGAIAAFLGWFVVRPDYLEGYAIAVNIVFGILTIWGLYWAASEFSEARIKPRLSLQLAEVAEEWTHPLKPIEVSPAHITGRRGPWDEAYLSIGFLVHNHSQKSARHLQLLLECDVQPSWESGELLGATSLYPCRTVAHGGGSFVLLFEDDLLVHPGPPITLTIVRFRWETDTLPTNFLLKYRISKSEGEADVGQHMIHIDWDESEPLWKETSSDEVDLASAPRA